MITEEYRKQNEQLHMMSPVYGVSGRKYAKRIQVAYMTTGCTSLLDYGCGKATLADELPQFKVTNYDPAVPRFSAPPEPHDFVACTDVMEHVEHEFIDAVLDDIKRLARRTAYFLINTRPAEKTLPDGRNAHISQHPYMWWADKIAQRWRIGQMVTHSNGDVEFTCYAPETDEVVDLDEVTTL